MTMTSLDQFAANESRHFIYRQRGFRNDAGIELEVMPHARKLAQHDAVWSKYPSGAFQPLTGNKNQ
jgi:hypothetical protein